MAARVYALITAVLFPAFSFAQFIPDGTKSAEFFETRIRPVLANNCYACHGEMRTSGLRLDARDGLIKGGNTGPAIIPGDPDRSLLIQAVTHTHERIKMPPGKKLADAEIADLKTWIRMGAPWPEGTAPAPPSHYTITPEQRAFWSFQPLRKYPPPEIHDARWARSPIDRFILAKLESAGLKPVSAASQRALIRRATFDLTGLPPRPEDVDAFLRDQSPGAFAKVLDRLLASPHFGERWGRHWLDIARYGEDDVRGLSRESYPNAWRYRDWVVEALNADMPYDRFVKAQIAGDLMGDPKLLPALGFFGLGPWYYDITVPPQARADERHDRVDALTRGFLGLTVACARCHNHKFDPVSTKDYYGLAGVFASSEYREYPLVPETVVEQYNAHQQKIREQEAAIDDYIQKLSSSLADTLAAKTDRYMIAAWKVSGPEKSSAEKAAAGDHLDTETLERWVKYLGRTERNHPFLNTWDKLIAARAPETEIAKFAHEFQTQLLAIDREKKAIDDENHARLVAAHPPSQKKKVTRLPNGFETYEDFCAGCDVELKSLPRDQYVVWNDLFGSGSSDGASGKKEEKTAIFVYNGKQIDRWLSGVWKERLDDMRTELERLKKTSPPEYPYLHGIGESDHPANLRVHLRGSPYNLGEEAPREFIAVLCNGDPAPFHNGSGRLELAEAVVSHPLFARVAVNRIWGHLFGNFLVATPSNFGKLGQRPTHPELLDYLASSLIENHWSRKALIREIMLSSAYQLSSDNDEHNFAEDPDNRLFWRMNRRRLDAEALRDSILFAAGTLDERLGGPSVDLATDATRRTIYGKVSRFKLEETLALFDFPSPGQTSEKRNVTNVPPQRLFYLNSDLVWNEAAQLAQHLKTAQPDETARIRTLYTRLFARPATDAEIELARSFVSGSDRRWTEYVQVLLSSNEFSFVD